MERQQGTDRVKRGMAEMQKGGVIMDVVNAEQAKIAEAAGAVAVMALERVPSDIRRDGGVARMADPLITEEVYSERSRFPSWQNAGLVISSKHVFSNRWGSISSMRVRS